MPDVVILHFTPRYQHAGHYALYVKGRGRARDYARKVIAGTTFFPNALVEAAFLAGCDITIGRIIHGGDRQERSRLRRNGSLSRFCDVCRSEGIHHP